MHFASYYRWLVFSYLFGRDGFPPITTAPILDIGCKGGEFLQRFQSPVRLGLDLSIGLLPRNAPGLLFAAGDAARLPVQSGFFGFVLLNDVIEHVVDDRATLQGAAQAVAPGGLLWISTPALNYWVGPGAITRHFERAWGHVRRGYRPETLIAMIGSGFQVRTVSWPEPLIRVMQAPLWALSRIAMPLARGIARACFIADRDTYTAGHQKDALHGHLYVSARRDAMVEA